MLTQPCKYILETKGNSDFTDGATAAQVAGVATATFQALQAMAPTATFIKICPPSRPFTNNTPWLNGFQAAFGALNPVATAGDATLYQGSPAYYNCFLIDLGNTISVGLQDNNTVTYAGFDSVHPDAAHNARIVGIVAYLMGQAVGSAGRVRITHSELQLSAINSQEIPDS